MNRNFTKIILGLMFIAFCGFAKAQTTVTGTVTDADSGEPLIGVNILVKGTVLGTITDVDGNFTLAVQSSPPFTLVISYVGYDRQEVEVSAGTTQVQVQLAEATLLGQEVVVSASRIEESTLKSPVSIERMDILDIQNAAAPDFYTALKNLNGVDFSTQSLTFNSVNARGFGANGNTRFVQLIDGIDNQAPGLNFPVGNVVGINELDLESVEMLPGASSALYGPNAIQGILLMNSKSPFDYQGLDFYSKLGVNHLDGEDDDAALYKDLGIRYAKSFNNKLAFKLTASWLNAQDFRGVDYRDQSDILERSGEIDPLTVDRTALRNYDGVNVYGDTELTVGQIADGAIELGQSPDATAEQQATAASLIGIRSLIPSGVEGAFTPAGYREVDFVDNTTESLKFGAALHYRLNDNLEVLGQYNIGYGSSVYTANDRFILDNFSIWTGKLELRGSDFYLRAYTTQENSGDSYAANALGQRILQDTYFTNYLGAWAGAIASGAIPFNNYDALHAAARAAADAEFAEVGSAAFNASFDENRNLSIADGGAKFLDKSALYHYEGSYNLRNVIDFAEIVVGANYRTYALNSEATLFTLDDNGDEVSYDEYGGYIQIRKDLIDNIALTASARYDKSEFFEGQFNPRVAAVWEFAPNHNLRGSYQTGFRIPTTQDQFIDLDVTTRRLIGRNDILRRKYNTDENPVYRTQSVEDAQLLRDVNQLEVASEAYEDYKPERVGTWEVGYKGLFMDGRLFIDAFYYQSTYKDLLAEIDVTQAVVTNDITSIPAGYDDGLTNGVSNHSDRDKEVFVAGGGQNITLERFGYDVNINEDVESRGGGIAAEYSIGNGYALGANASYNEIVSLSDLVAQEFNVAFNTPEWRYNIKFSNRKLTDRIGFNLTYRWQDAFLWQSAIGSGVIPAFGTLDAQVSYDIPSMNAKLKLGGSNVTNNRYTTSLANPRIGALYYIQLNLNNLLK